MKLVPLIALLGGCSFALMKDAPTYRYEPRCTPTLAPPIVDAAIALAAAATMVKTISDFPSDPNTEADSDDKTFAVVAGVTAAIMVGSSAYGFRSAARCRNAPPHESLPEAPPQPIAVHRGPLPLNTPLVELVPARDPNAARLTHEVHSAALHGDCTHTREVAVEVKDADSAYYVGVFLRDEAIARCLRATPGPAVP